MEHKKVLSELVLVCSATLTVHIKFKPSSLHATERLATLIVAHGTELDSVHLVKAENYYYYNFPEIIKKLLRKLLLMITGHATAIVQNNFILNE
jgi:hypothetical protein